ncbi:hypothetical protein KZZ20_00995 [Methylacidiphilum fumariolicum]|uniref:Uncharacterized protein n=2 Tax=Candidatus Methylacidiphilum fumarolicum TaxID=591154 RepID=I0JVT9_METFB|nr:hypothetical protein [Candidatus Methylacidiphilum fumarolicum]MBW6414106.1 hypothetical protein [Candidatus Methylacidiphilum fumarolicum]CAI9086520.1 conserved protein of unknown function [Candidatus Methylacidiphilum fumarolicum]CCG91358.1 hypothetical protein MFUM_1020083 [Methylacidiphilum fumariolicum SolV]
MNIYLIRTACDSSQGEATGELTVLKAVLRVQSTTTSRPPAIHPGGLPLFSDWVVDTSNFYYTLIPTTPQSHISGHH